MKTPVILVTALMSTAQMFAQSTDHHGHHAQPYAGMQSREVKALSSEEVEQLRAGSGMGFAQAAELNRYPGPMHVLEMADELGLTDEQRVTATRAFDEMRKAAVERGEKIITTETHLDVAFADASIDEERLAKMTGHIAALRGELRAVHLKAHLVMKRVLTDEQITKYDRLRGY